MLPRASRNSTKADRLLTNSIKPSPQMNSHSPTHPNQLPVIIDSPGDYRTRNGRRVTIHEIKPTKAGHDCLEFCAKGSFWKSHEKMGINPEYGIWHVSGLSRGIGINQNDIVQKW